VAKINKPIAINARDILLSRFSPDDLFGAVKLSAIAMINAGSHRRIAHSTNWREKTPCKYSTGTNEKKSADVERAAYALLRVGAAWGGADL
jgi:hypothetical protein